MWVDWNIQLAPIRLSNSNWSRRQQQRIPSPFETHSRYVTPFPNRTPIKFPTFFKHAILCNETNRPTTPTTTTTRRLDGGRYPYTMVIIIVFVSCFCWMAAAEVIKACAFPACRWTKCTHIPLGRASFILTLFCPTVVVVAGSWTLVRCHWKVNTEGLLPILRRK